MDLAISLGQGVGLAVACGLVALVPLLIGAIAAAAGALPGALGSYDDTPVLAGSAVLAIANAGAAAFIAGTARIALAAGGGAAVCEMTAGAELPLAPLAIGAVVGALAAWAFAGVLDGARDGGGTRGGVAALAAGASAVVAGLAIVPFVGYILLGVAIWFAIRVRRKRDRKFAGLRVLR